MRWTDVVGESGYTMQWSSGSHLHNRGRLQNGTTNATNIVSSNVTRGVLWYARVRAYNNGGWSDWVTLSIVTP